MYQVVLALLIFHVCLYAHLAEASEGEITFQLTGIENQYYEEQIFEKIFFIFWNSRGSRRQKRISLE